MLKILRKLFRCKKPYQNLSERLDSEEFRILMMRHRHAVKNSPEVEVEFEAVKKWIRAHLPK